MESLTNILTLKDKEIYDMKKTIINMNDVLQMTKKVNSEQQKKIENLEIQNRTLEEIFIHLKKTMKI